VRHDSLRPAVPKDPRASHVGSSAAPARTTHSGGAPSAPAAAPSHMTHSGGAPSAPATNSGTLKMLQGIFTICRCTDQCLDVMD
jgi:hypothetical protein